MAPNLIIYFRFHSRPREQDLMATGCGEVGGRHGMNCWPRVLVKSGWPMHPSRAKLLWSRAVHDWSPTRKEARKYQKSRTRGCFLAVATGGSRPMLRADGEPCGMSVRERLALSGHPRLFLSPFFLFAFPLPSEQPRNEGQLPHQGGEKGKPTRQTDRQGESGGGAGGEGGRTRFVAMESKVMKSGWVSVCYY